MSVLTAHMTKSNSAFSFELWWRHHGHWVEPPNQRRGGESGVQLLQPSNKQQPVLYCKRQIGHLYRSWRYPFGRPTVLRERDAISAFTRLGIRVPWVIYCAARRQDKQWQAVLVTEELAGFISLEQWYADEYHKAMTQIMLQQLATTLANLHRNGWQHGCCYPKHIFIKTLTRNGQPPTIEIALLDLEKSRRRWRAANASRHDMEQLKRHRGAMPAEDIEYLQRAYQQALSARP